MLEAVSAEAKYCIGSTPASTRLCGVLLRPGNCANRPKMMTYTVAVKTGTSIAQATPRNVCL